MKIAFFELEGWEDETIKQSFPKDELYLSKEKLTAETVQPAADAEIVSIFIGSKIGADLLAHFANLKLITTRSTGFDHIDLAACKAKNVVVSSVPGYGDNTVAEYAFGLLLSLTRKIYRAVDQIKETESFSLEGLEGVDIKGKVMGIVGTGRIGKEAIRIARGFGMTVWAYDLYPDQEFAKANGVKYVSLEELLKNADAVSLHCPLTPQTEHLINKENVKLFKKGAFLVNTSRGGIVDTDAVLLGLKEGIFGGVALDVLEEERDMKDELDFVSDAGAKEENLRTVLENHVLMKQPNVLVSPHNAFNTKEALARILATTIGNVQSFAAGKPTNVVKG